MTRRPHVPIDWAAVRNRLAALSAPPDPDLDRLILEARARKLAGRPVVPGPIAPLEVLTMTLSGRPYAIALDQVVEVVRLSSLTRLPSSPPEVLGLTSLRGEITLVVDLRPVFGLDVATLGDLGRLVAVGAGRPELAIAADAVSTVQTIDRARLSAPPATLPGRAARLTLGVGADGLVLLDAEALLDDPDLFLTEAPLET